MTNHKQNPFTAPKKEAPSVAATSRKQLGPMPYTIGSVLCSLIALATYGGFAIWSLELLEPAQRVSYQLKGIGLAIIWMGPAFALALLAFFRARAIRRETDAAARLSNPQGKA